MIFDAAEERNLQDLKNLELLSWKLLRMRTEACGESKICIKLSKFKMAASSSDGSEESLASLCREAEQLKVKIDEEKQKCNDVQRK